VYKNTLATVENQIQQAEKPMPAVVISAEAARVDNAILLAYLTSNVTLVEHVIGSTDRNIPIDNNCTDNQLHVRMPGVVGITKMKVTKATSAMVSPLPASYHGLRLN
jgi:hypothetical protein